MSGSKKPSISHDTADFTSEGNDETKLNDDRDKIVKVINKQFEDELKYRDSQFELIQQRLNDAQKAMHLLRYILITSYYNENEKMSNMLEDQALNEGSRQNRLHPAVKKLLGNKSENYKFDFVKGKRRRTQNMETKVKLEKLKDVKTEEVTNLGENRTEIKEESEPFDNTRNRKKSKYHIVVGNISKTIVSNSKEDKSTHKWMVYVRGSRENPDISHFVQKVVLYLHPSYSPNDVVEIREPPFHLSRRGWGEFPLRVRIFFHCPLNKPVDIIHNLKLDTTFSGRQTLGNETLVDLKLFDLDQEVVVKQEDIESTASLECETNKRKTENCDIFSEVNKKIKLEEDEVTETSIKQEVFQDEHDYCFPNIKIEPCEEVTNEPILSNYVLEHSYSVISNPTANHDFKTTLEQQESNLIYGITNEEENDVIEEPVLEEVRVVTKKVTKRGLVITAPTNHESLLKNMFYKKYDKKFTQGISILRSNSKINGIPPKSNGIDYDKHKIVLPSHRFKNAYECLFYLFKRLPIITERGSDIHYRCTFPYTSASFDEFSKWNIGKRLSSEWFRAKTIRNIISKSQLPLFTSITTRDIIMYGRCHGFMPLANYNMCKNYKFPVLDEINGSHSQNILMQRRSDSLKEPDIEIDIINSPSIKTESSNEDETKLRLVDHEYNMACSYVKDAALDVGIILKSEELIPGVLFNATERVLLQAGLCLAEDLIRKAQSNRIIEGKFDEKNCVLQVEDIKKAFNSKQHCKALIEKYVNYRKHYL